MGCSHFAEIGSSMEFTPRVYPTGAGFLAPPVFWTLMFDIKDSVAIGHEYLIVGENTVVVDRTRVQYTGSVITCAAFQHLCGIRTRTSMRPNAYCRMRMTF